MAHPNEEAVYELVNKIGLGGLMQGLLDHLYDQQSSLPPTKKSEEADAAHVWFDRLITLAEMSLPYAMAVSGSGMESNERSDLGASITIKVKQRASKMKCLLQRRHAADLLT